MNFDLKDLTKLTPYTPVKNSVQRTNIENMNLLEWARYFTLMLTALSRPQIWNDLPEDVASA